MSELAKVRIEIPMPDGRVVVETPWAEDLGGDRYRLDNTPWWRGDLNWRDVVRAESRDLEDFPTVVEVVEPGGHQTFRLLFDARTDAAEQDRVLDEVAAAGGTYEGTAAEREGIYAVDVAPDASLAAVEEVLRRAAAGGTLAYELGGSPEFIARLDEATVTGNSTARHAQPEGGLGEPVLVECAGHPVLDRVRYEQLWALPRGPDEYEVRSAAFAAYDLFVGDVVRVEREAGRLPRVTEVVRRSGRLLIRVIVDEDVDPQAVAKELEARGARVERSGQWPLMLAVDIAGDAQALELRAWLDAEEAAGRLGYETAWA